MPRNAEEIANSSRKQQRRDRNDPNNLHYNQKKVDNPVISQELAEKLLPKKGNKSWTPEYK